MSGFKWLHVSDIHLHSDSNFDLQLAIGSLLKRIEEIKPIDAIFATGDLAFRGTSEEYERVLDFLERLRVAGSVPADRVFVVPGNHDINRNRIRPFHRVVVDDDPDARDRFFGDGRSLELWAEKFKDFATLGTKYPKTWRNGRYPSVVDVFQAADRRIGVAGLNTAWMVNDKEEKDYYKEKLLLGRRLLHDALDEVNGLHPDIVFVLMHHPLDWLHPHEQREIRDLLSQRADIVLSGHLHETELTRLRTVSGEASFFQAGAVNQGSRHPRRFLVGEWDAQSHECHVRAYTLQGATTTAKWQVEQALGEEEKPWTIGAATSEGSRLKLCDTAAPLTMKVVPARRMNGSLSEAVACLYLDGSEDVLAEVEYVRHRCEGGLLDEFTWTNREAQEDFAQTVPVLEKVVVRSTVVFRDMSERAFDEIHLEVV